MAAGRHILAALAIGGGKIVVHPYLKLRIRWQLRAACIAAVVISLAALSCQKAPLGSLDRARKAVKAAADAGSLRYAENNYRKAQKLLTAGWMEMARQNGRLAPFRNYTKADSILTLAAKAAGDAARISRDMARNLDSLARSERNSFNAELNNWRGALDGSLDDLQAEKYWASAELALAVSDGLIRNTEYEEALGTVRKGRRSLRQLEDAVANRVNDQARKIAVWRRWVRETIDNSRSGRTTAVIIDKSSHKAHLIKSGELVKSYSCELGYNSAHQKLFSGDGATPEGVYRVTKVRNRSRFYKALLLDYPNPTDLQRFRSNKNRGIISRYARIGALIEIHGEGGKKEDWTDGCVTLANDDIDHLMLHISVGTQVTIVRKSDQWP